MWKTPSNERMYEVQPLEGNSSGTAQRYTQQQARRYSDFGLATIPASGPPPIPNRRRASEMPRIAGALPPAPQQPPPPPPRQQHADAERKSSTGIVCTNSDLLNILNSLTSSATEINRAVEEECSRANLNAGTSKSQLEQRRDRLKGHRSNSFDVSILHGCQSSETRTEASTSKSSSKNSTSNSSSTSGASIMSPSTWFLKRHQPMAKKQRTVDLGSPTQSSTGSSFKFDLTKFKSAKESLLSSKTSPAKEDSSRHKVVWDGTSGTKVDAQV